MMTKSVKEYGCDLVAAAKAYNTIVAAATKDGYRVESVIGDDGDQLFVESIHFHLADEDCWVGDVNE